MVKTKAARAFGQDSKIRVQKIYPRALRNVGQLKWKCTMGIYSQGVSPQWVLPRCREGGRDSGSAQHDLDAVSETAGL